MAKTLYVLRHGKSKRGPEFDTDFERTLAPRGQRDAVVVGKLLRSFNPPPQLIIASQAARARETAELVAAELDEPSLQFDEGLYGATSIELMQAVQHIPEHFNTVLIVGHNPGLEGLIDELTDAFDTLLKTCSLAVLEGEADTWAELSSDSCRLVRLIHPKEIAGGEEDN
jgi:phosphohistidine phosphatase